jgi:hypothetical protein
MVLRLTTVEFLELGLEIAGFGGQRQRSVKIKIRRFRGHYGISPEACSAVFVDLQTTAIAKARIDKPDIHSFLMALDWLKTYKTEEQMAGAFGNNEKTIRLKVWKYIGAVQAFKRDKVSELL